MQKTQFSLINELNFHLLNSIGSLINILNIKMKAAQTGRNLICPYAFGIFYSILSKGKREIAQLHD